MPILSLPMKLQRSDSDCGTAVFRCIAEYWGARKSRVPNADPLHGTHPDALEPAFRRAGFSVLSGEMDVGVLRQLTAYGWPVACLVKTAGGDGHWVAVAGVMRNRVHFMDPLVGIASLPVTEWGNRWHDYDRRGTVFRRFGLAVWWD